MSDQPRPSCPVCYREQADWLMCKGCSDRLVRQLREMPGLLHELRVTIERRDKIGVGGKSSGETPLPFKIVAQTVEDSVRMELSTWVRELDFGDTRDLADNPRAWCNWLADRIERIRGNNACEEIAAGITYFTGEILRAIDRPADLEFVGKCEVCESDLYVRHGEAEAVCRKCERDGTEARYDAVAMRDEVMRRVEHQWATAAGCAAVLAAFGLAVRAETVQNWAREQLPRWKGDVKRPAKLHAQGVNAAGHRLFRVGDVIDLARARAARRVESA